MIRKIEPRDLNTIMDIRLNANHDVHPFIDRQYWEDKLATVRDAIALA